MNKDKFNNKLILYFIILFIPVAGCGDSSSADYFINQELKEGDLVFRKGKSVKSQVVLRADVEGMYSHAGIIVKMDFSYMVLHTSPGEREDGQQIDVVKIEPIGQFFSKQRAEKGEVMRFTDSLEYSYQAANYAIEFYNQSIPFDHNYDLQDSTSMYCTELIWKAFNRAGRDITGGRRSVIDNFGTFSGSYIFPSDITSNEKLQTIYKF